MARHSRSRFCFAFFHAALLVIAFAVSFSGLGYAQSYPDKRKHRGALHAGSGNVPGGAGFGSDGLSIQYCFG